MEVIEWIKNEMRKGSSEEVIRETLELLGYNSEQINSFIEKALSQDANSKESYSIDSLHASQTQPLVETKKIKTEKKKAPPHNVINNTFDRFSRLTLKVPFEFNIYNTVLVLSLLYALSFIMVVMR